jgi:nucleoside-diphosphate-sugar epimerase
VGTVSGERVLVTGGSGFIGSTLVEELVRRGADVTCVLLPPDPAAHLEEVRQEIRICRADLTDREAVREAVSAARPEVVFHLAAAGVTDVCVDPATAARVNVEGTLNLLSALQGNYRVFVNTGTCHEYGGNEPPFREDQDPRPELPYAITKTAAWHFCNRYRRTVGWPIVTLRPFSVYGPRQAPNTFIPACIRAAQVGRDFDMTLGEQTRDCVYVDDIVEGFILAATVPEAIGETLNLCTSREVPLYQIAQVIVQQMGHPIAIHRGPLPYREGEIWRLVGDNTRAREVLGWESRVPLAEGLRRTIAAAQEHEGALDLPA